MADEGNADAEPNSSNSNDVEPPKKVGKMVEFSLNPIRDQLVCKLCDGLFREPYMTTKCRHTFCKSCLLIAINGGCYSCHVCDTYLGKDLSKFALADRTMQVLIDKILFPAVAQRDDELEAEFYRERGIPRKATNDSYSGSNYNNKTKFIKASISRSVKMEEQRRPLKTSATSATTSTTPRRQSHGQHQQQADRKKRRLLEPKQATEISAASFSSTHSVSSGPIGRSGSSVVVFQLVPDQKKGRFNDGDGSRRHQPTAVVKALDHPYMRTDGRIRIGQLKKYLRMKLFSERGGEKLPDEESERLAQRQSLTQRQVDNPIPITICCNGAPLGNELSVHFVLRTVWMEPDDKELILTYFY